MLELLAGDRSSQHAAPRAARCVAQGAGLAHRLQIDGYTPKCAKWQPSSQRTGRRAPKERKTGGPWFEVQRLRNAATADRRRDQRQPCASESGDGPGHSVILVVADDADVGYRGAGRTASVSRRTTVRGANLIFRLCSHLNIHQIHGWDLVSKSVWDRGRAGGGRRERIEGIHCIHGCVPGAGHEGPVSRIKVTATGRPDGGIGATEVMCSVSLQERPSCDDQA